MRIFAALAIVTSIYLTDAMPLNGKAVMIVSFIIADPKWSVEFIVNEAGGVLSERKK